MSLEPGQVLSHYRIERKLGKGGMGEVYRALDTRLKRSVALKVLPADTAADPERLARFQREAEIVAALNHPHIVTIHSVEEADEIRFLTMELVDGEGLDVLLRAGPLPLEQVIDIGIALADALDAAHRKGIIHRDLKPANVMIAVGGRVKVLDFGLAKLGPGALPDAGDGTGVPTAADPLTVAGVVMGSGPYMSPEQVNGRELDPRSDLFSLGILLHEMIAGRRPFVGETVMEAMLSILRDTPPPLARRRPGVPRELAATIERCLEKDPGRRPPSAAAVGEALEAVRASGTPSPAGHSRAAVWILGAAALAVLAAVGWWLRTADRGGELLPAEPAGTSAAAPAADPATVSIAVLPFVNLSGDDANEYFSDGLSEELIATLADLRGLRVAGRTSSFQFKGDSTDLRVIGRKLNVGNLLEGSVRADGDRVRITVQLVDAGTGLHRWSETYDRPRADVFAVQSEIARAVAAALELQLLAEEEAVAPATPASAPAYDRLLQARHLLGRVSAENTAAARRLLEETLAAEPGYAVAWSELGLAHARAAALEADPGRQAESYRQARRALERALEIDPRLASAHARLARVAADLERDFAAAERHAAAALELAPADPVVISNAAAIEGMLGRLDRALELDRVFLEIDPLSAGGRFNYTLDLIRAGRLEKAAAAAGALEEANPGPLADGLRAQIDLLAGRAADALAGFERTGNAAGIAMAQHSLGDPAASDAALRALEEQGDRQAVSCAEVHAWRGDSDAAFDWLERARRAGHRSLSHVKVNPLLRGLHGDPRWEAFLREVGLPAEQPPGLRSGTGS